MLVALRINDNKLKCFVSSNLYSLCRFHATAFCSLAWYWGRFNALLRVPRLCFEVYIAVKHDSQCTYKVKLRNIRVTVIAVEKQ